ncbi:putative MFS family arabinose efflux permease [Asanoa ferruginea]|uniref:Putative MFS family arabinose efflux permease n=1 Tax=Asanoa ferruginea TaxID=53367 RepID=A0A3D9ZEB0_9ACTN|nr:MFS transporter [Asanoa ferruginea]REF94854.1 putative MFS family arabinose efflux permease [Asanoa ferruginea]GIF45567.1 MFS transporter [Asanoa ferruginea]
MRLAPYRAVLRLPGVRPLLIVAILARVPSVAAGVTLTLHVVFELHRGYFAAGLVGTASTVGAAIGAPLLGRLVDRRGLRPVLAICTIAEGVFWSVAGSLPYPVLLVLALVSGVLMLPVFSVVRQSLAALVPAEHRRPAYALDSMSVELSFMVGPALAVLLATSVSPHATMFAVGAGVVLSGTALFIFNPPVRAASEESALTGPTPSRRSWLSARMVAILAIAVATTLVLGGTDVTVVAVLREAGQVSWTGLVLALWGVYSLIGGFVYGSLRRVPSPLMLLAVLAFGTLLVALAGPQWFLVALALIPAGALCAPALAAAADAVSHLAPPSVRGEAMGLHGSAITVGLALGAPLAGWVIDMSSPRWGFVATGAAGLLVALAVLPIYLIRRRPPAVPATPSQRTTEPSLAVSD